MKSDLNERLEGDISRRQFVKWAVAAGVTAGTSPAWAVPEIKDGMIYRTLGHTGEKVSLVGVGGFHIGSPIFASEGIRIIQKALDRGINFLDNAWDYHDGESEIRMGKALRGGYREKAFLMTKIDGRTRSEATRQIDESLKRLQTDHVDLLQFHEVIRMSDPDAIFAPGGAAEAFLEAKKQGKLRYMGFTGHKDPSIHLKMLQLVEQHQFPLDTVQMPLNVMDAHFLSFTHLVLPELVKKNLGVLGMKSMGSGIILKSGVVKPMECLHYAMNLPVSVVITGMDSLKIVDQALEAVRTFQPMSPGEITALLDRTAQAGMHGDFEKFKTSTIFDSTAKHPEWLG
jgi:predicted aldo/keto reductase-like oxidoreductase